MMEAYVLLKQLWVIWFLVLFTGICVWVYWPTRRDHLDAQASIPLRDGEPSAGQTR